MVYLVGGAITATLAARKQNIRGDGHAEGAINNRETPGNPAWAAEHFNSPLYLGSFCNTFHDLSLFDG